MDLLQEFQRKAELLSKEDVHEGIQAAVRHVRSAERHLLRARNENDEDLLNDVVYRTNQAFEGMLKEAYTVLTDHDAARLTPHQVEQHLLNQNVFPSRVLELFRNYREQWRNPSTHNHRLFFSEQEALLAIVSVTAFAIILLDLIIETVSFKREKEAIEAKKRQATNRLLDHATLPFNEQLLRLLHDFSEDLKHSDETLPPKSEAELTGRLHAFISSVAPSIRIMRDFLIPNSPMLRPDLTLMRDGDTVLIELKSASINKRSLDRAQDQMLAYLEAGNYDHGIVYLPPSNPDQPMEEHEVNLQSRDRTMTIHVVAPQGNLRASGDNQR